MRNAANVVQEAYDIKKKYEIEDIDKLFYMLKVKHFEMFEGDFQKKMLQEAHEYLGRTYPKRYHKEKRDKGIAFVTKIIESTGDVANPKKKKEKKRNNSE